MFPECLKYWTTNYYTKFVITTSGFPSIQNPFIQFHTQAIFFKDYVLNARNKAITQYLENSCIDKIIYKNLVTRSELTYKG